MEKCFQTCFISRFVIINFLITNKLILFLEEHVTQRFSPPPSTTNPETSSNLFDTYDISIDNTPIAPPLLKTFLPPTTNENSPPTNSIFTVQKQVSTIDYEDNTQNIIMNHLHSVKSLKKFFETKMVIQRPLQTAVSSQPNTTNDEQKLDRASMTREQNSTDELEQRQEMMNKVLESLKKKKVYTRTTTATTTGKII